MVSILFFSEDDKCQYDYVEIFDGMRAKNASLGRFCGSLPSSIPIYSKTNRMLVTFHSDTSVKGRGFKAVYKG